MLGASSTTRRSPQTATPSIGARDGIPRTFSNDPAVHRALVVVDPPMEGRDVANLQRATKKCLKARGLDDDVPVPTHGKFTLATAITPPPRPGSASVMGGG